MFNQNVYIIYPAGYMGTYINWMLCASEKQTQAGTVLSPVTATGTAHNHLKIPTHQSWAKTLTWIAYNRPTGKRVYSINARYDKNYHDTSEYAIQNIMRIDDNPVIINCHDSGNLDQQKFGALNMFTKWPTYISARGVWHKEYNPSDDTNIIRARNWLLDHWLELNPGNRPINPDIVMYNLDAHRAWYQIRVQTAALELTPDQYLIPDKMPNALLDVALSSIVSPDFPNIMQQWVETLDLGDWDFTRANEYHSTYVASQVNLKWFECIRAFRKDQTIDPWLLSNAMSQAFLLMEFSRDSLDLILDQSTESILEKLL
jgi:hypothetical protein